MKKVIILLMISGLQACATNSDLGESHRNNRAAQVVNPQAAETGFTAEGMDGIKAGIAIEEYKSADNRNSNERLVRDVAN